MRSARAWGEKLRSPVVRNAAYLIATEAVGGVLGLAFWAAVAPWAGCARGGGPGIPVLGFLGSEPALLVLFVLFCAVWTMSLLFDASFVGLGDARPVFLRAVVHNAT